MEWLQTRRWWGGLGRWEKLALSVWLAAVAALLVNCLLAPAGRGSVYPAYHWAAQRWLHGTDTYPSPGAGPDVQEYRYSPLVTATLAPLGLLPLKAGEVLWRLLIVGCFMGGLSLWMAEALTPSANRSQKAILLLLIFPLTIGNVHNGQANLLVMGLLLLTLFAVLREHWGLAAACAALAAFFKVYPIALGLMLASIYPRRFLAKFLVALLIGLLVPFVCQDPIFVARQYRLWFEHLRVEDRSLCTLDMTYANLQLICRVWLVPISSACYRLIELGAAVLLASLCIAARWLGGDPRRLLSFTLDTACCWMTAFGPATESPTYMLLAPSLAWAALASRAAGRSFWVRGLYLACYGGLLSTTILVLISPKLFHAYRVLGPQPSFALLFLVVRVLDHFLTSERIGVRATTAPVSAARAA
jgi:Glycosyltransferase family 87